MLLDDIVLAKWPRLFPQDDKNIEDLKNFLNRLTDGRIAEVGAACRGVVNKLSRLRS